LIALVLIFRKWLRRDVIISAAVIGGIVVFNMIFSFVYDYVQAKDCFTRVKLIYGLNLFMFSAWWGFEAKLSYEINNNNKLIQDATGIKIALAVALLTRICCYCQALYFYTWSMGFSGVCSTVLVSLYNQVDKTAELIYALFVGGVFIYRCLANMDILKKTSMAGAKSKTFTLIKTIASERGFIIFVHIAVEIVYLCVVFTAPDPTSVTAFNNFTINFYPAYMMWYICFQLERNMQLSKLKSGTTVAKDDSKSEVKGVGTSSVQVSQTA